MEKGEWTKRDGWPTEAEDWRKLQGWIVRAKLGPTCAMRASFPQEINKIYRDLFPLLRFTSLED
jgi:hypothetical protein